MPGHRRETAPHVLHPGEVRHHAMGPGVDEQLGGKGIVLGQATAPRPTMDEDMDRRAGACGAVDVEGLDRGRTVGIALWRTQVRTRDRAVAPVAGDELLAVRRPRAPGILR